MHNSHFIMNCTLLKLIINFSLQSSPFLMIPSYSFQNNLLLSKIKISHCNPPFYKSSSVNSKIIVKSSSFSSFLGAAFHIDSDSTQCYGEKIEDFTGIYSYFISCFFSNTFISSRLMKTHFDSCLFRGSDPEDFMDMKITDITHCTFENIGPVESKNISVNQSIFYNALTPYHLVRCNYITLSSANFTHCQVRQGIYGNMINLNFIIIQKNQISQYLFRHGIDSSIKNSIISNNTLQYLSSTATAETHQLIYDNSCIFVDDASKFVDSQILFVFEKCCFNLQQNEIIDYFEKFKAKLVPNRFDYNFNDCTFNSDECNSLDINNIIPSPKKFNYKIIGDDDEEFKYD